MSFHFFWWIFIPSNNWHLSLSMPFFCCGWAIRGFLWNFVFHWSPTPTLSLSESVCLHCVTVLFYFNWLCKFKFFCSFVKFMLCSWVCYCLFLFFPWLIAFSAMVDGRSQEISTKELSGGARIRYIFQSIFVKTLEVQNQSLRAHYFMHIFLKKISVYSPYCFLLLIPICLSSHTFLSAESD